MDSIIIDDLDNDLAPAGVAGSVILEIIFIAIAL